MSARVPQSRSGQKKRRGGGVGGGPANELAADASPTRAIKSSEVISIPMPSNQTESAVTEVLPAVGSRRGGLNRAPQVTTRLSSLFVVPQGSFRNLLVIVIAFIITFTMVLFGLSGVGSGGAADVTEDAHTLRIRRQKQDGSLTHIRNQYDSGLPLASASRDNNNRYNKNNNNNSLGVLKSGGVVKSNISADPRRAKFRPFQKVTIPREDLILVNGAEVPPIYRRWGVGMATDAPASSEPPPPSSPESRHMIPHLIHSLAVTGMLDSILEEVVVYDHNVVNMLQRIATSHPYSGGAAPSASSFRDGWQLDLGSDVSFGAPDLESEVKYMVATAKRRWAGATDEEVDLAFEQHIAHPHDAIDFVTNPSQAKCSKRRSFIPQGFRTVSMTNLVGKPEHAAEAIDVVLKRHWLHTDRTTQYCVDEDGEPDNDLWGSPYTEESLKRSNDDSAEGSGFDPISTKYQRLLIGKSCHIHRGQSHPLNWASVEGDDAASYARDEALNAQLSTRRLLSNAISAGDPPDLFNSIVALNKGQWVMLRDAYDCIVTSPSKMTAVERSLHAATVHLLMVHHRPSALHGNEHAPQTRAEREAAFRNSHYAFVEDLRDEDAIRHSEKEGGHAASRMSLRHAFTRCMLSLSYSQNSRSIHKTLSFGSFPFTASEKVAFILEKLASASSAEHVHPSHLCTASSLVNAMIEHSFVVREWAPLSGEGESDAGDTMGDASPGRRRQIPVGRRRARRDRLGLHAGSTAQSHQAAHAAWLAKLSSAARTLRKACERGGGDSSTMFGYSLVVSEVLSALRDVYQSKGPSDGSFNEDGSNRFQAEESFGPGTFATLLQPLPVRFTIRGITSIASDEAVVPTVNISHPSSSSSAEGVPSHESLLFALVEAPPPSPAVSPSRGDKNPIPEIFRKSHSSPSSSHASKEIRSSNRMHFDDRVDRMTYDLIRDAEAVAACHSTVAARALLFQLWRLDHVCHSGDDADSSSSSQSCEVDTLKAMVERELAVHGVTIPFLLRVIHSGVARGNRESAREARNSVNPSTFCNPNGYAKLAAVLGADSGTASPLVWFDTHVLPHFMTPQVAAVLKPLGVTLASLMHDSPHGASPSPPPLLPTYNDGASFIDIGGPSDALAKAVNVKLSMPVRRFLEGPRRAATHRLGECMTDLARVDGEISGIRRAIISSRWQGNVTLVVRNQTDESDGGSAGRGNKENAMGAIDSPPLDDGSPPPPPPPPPQQYALRCEGVPHDETTPLHSPVGDVGGMLVGLTSQKLFPLSSLDPISSTGRSEGEGDAASSFNHNRYAEHTARERHRMILLSYRRKGEVTFHRSLLSRIGLYEGLRRYGGGSDGHSIAPYSIHHYILGGESSAVNSLRDSILLKNKHFEVKKSNGAQMKEDILEEKQAGVDDDGRGVRSSAPQSNVPFPFTVPEATQSLAWVPQSSPMLQDLCDVSSVMKREECFMAFPVNYDEVQAVCDVGRAIRRGGSGDSGTLTVDHSHGTVLLAVAAQQNKQSILAQHRMKWLAARDRGDPNVDERVPWSLSHSETCLDIEDYGRSAFSSETASHSSPPAYQPNGDAISRRNLVVDVPRALWRHPIPTTSIDDVTLGWRHTRGVRALHSHRDDGVEEKGHFSSQFESFARLLSQRVDPLLRPASPFHSAHLNHFAPYHPPNTLQHRLRVMASTFSPSSSPTSSSMEAFCKRIDASVFQACKDAPLINATGRFDRSLHSQKRGRPIPVERTFWSVLAGITERSEATNCSVFELISQEASLLYYYEGGAGYASGKDPTTTDSIYPLHQANLAMCHSERIALQLASPLGMSPRYAHLQTILSVRSEMIAAVKKMSEANEKQERKQVASVLHRLRNQLNFEVSTSTLLSSLSSVVAKVYIVRINEPLLRGEGQRATRNRMFHRTLLNCGAKHFMSTTIEGSDDPLKNITTEGLINTRPRLIIHHGYDSAPSSNRLWYTHVASGVEEPGAYHMASCGMVPSAKDSDKQHTPDRGDTILFAMNALGYTPYHDPAPIDHGSASASTVLIRGLPSSAANSHTTIVWVLKGFEEYCRLCKG